VNKPQQHEKPDELVQLVTGVLLCAFALIAVAVLLTMQVQTVLTRY
jgi:hypothetical protein